MEAQIIPGDHVKRGSAPVSLQGPAVRSTVEMAVAAHLHAVFPQQPQDLRALVPLIQRRIMEEAQLLAVACRLQGGFQPPYLPQQHLFVVGALVVQLIEPPPGAAQGHVPVKAAVVVEDLHGGQAVFRKEPLHFGGGVPPVVVVALEQVFLPRQGVDEPEILQGFLQAHAPGQVAAAAR